MAFGAIIPSHLSALSVRQSLDLYKIYLENANRTKDHDIALVLCHEAKVALSQAKNANRKHPVHPLSIGNSQLREEMANAYINLGKLLEREGYRIEGQAVCRKAEKWGGGRPAYSSVIGGAVQLQSPPLSAGGSQDTGPQLAAATVPAHIFADDLPQPAIGFKLPEPDERLNNTRQLVCCLGLLQSSRPTDDVLDPTVRKWLQVTEKDVDERERLRMMATELIREFEQDEIKDAKAVAEVVCLAPVLNKDSFHELLGKFYSGIDRADALDFYQLEGLARLIKDADPGHLNANDLVKILELVSTRLRNIHQQSAHHIHQLVLAVSHVLDAMADTKVTGLDRERLREPLSTYLDELKESKDPYLVYQASYAYQALQCVTDNEPVWQAAVKHTGKVIQGGSGLVSSVESLDLNKFLKELEGIKKGFPGAFKLAAIVKAPYEDVTTFAQSGQGLLECIQEELSFARKRDWYSALRGADMLIRNGELSTFKKLVCDAPCRYDAAFQWGVCQRLGEIATDPMRDGDIRRSAVRFLGEIYRDDKVWGQQANIKQWILNILMQIASSSTGDMQFDLVHAAVAESLLQEQEACEDAKKQALYRQCRKDGPTAYPLKVALPGIASPSLLDRAQNKPNVEGNLRMLRKQRAEERGNTVYVPPQAKASFQAADNSQFPLMEKVQEFLASERKVFLLLGDSGVGKSTFSRGLEFELWQSYEKKTGWIPLNIDLAAVKEPEHDMVAKQLRKFKFTETQIRELKHHRKFILICDGYDESQQTHNLYTSNQLNQPGEWTAQMVISCRSDYLGSDYRDRFRPGDRNQLFDSSLFQEAVMMPFSINQIQAYIQQYVSLHRPPWRVGDYEETFKRIPSLTELSENPFLLSLSLEVLPRMVDSGPHLSNTQVTRLMLYDHFIEQWFERSKERLEKMELLPQRKAAFERLSAEGLAPNGIEYLKRFAVAIYEEQDGRPVVEYSQLLDEGSWKDAFFTKEYMQLILEASPLAHQGNQHRFIHRLLLEYVLARAIFDPQDKRSRVASFSGPSRRESMLLTVSSDVDASYKESTILRELDLRSPLVWRDFVNDYSLLQFLEERVQREPVFKEQLLRYIEHSKGDSVWSTAAANSITILVRAGVQFIGADLQGIQIPGADLSYGQFDSAQLQGADMRNVDLRGAWLRQANLSGAQMAGVQLGELPYLTENEMVDSCTYSLDGKSFAVGLVNGDIHLYTTSIWEQAQTLNGHTASVQSIAYSPRGDQIASGCRDKTVRLWDVGTGTCLHVLTDHTGEVNCVAYSPQEDQVASASDDKTIRLWNPVSGKCLWKLSGHSGRVLSIAYAPSGGQIASGSEDSTVRLWNVETGSCSRSLSGHSSSIWEVAYSPQGDYLASAGNDKTIRLWDVRTGACQHTLTGHTKRVESVAYSPNGDRVASGGMDEMVHVWDVETGLCCHTLIGHSNIVTKVVYSPNGDQIASSSFDKTVRLWDVSPRASRFVSSSHASAVHNVQCLLNGDQIATCSDDQTVRLWDAGTGICRQIMTGHDSKVFSVACSPRGGRIASGGADNAVRLWDVETGECTHTLLGHTNGVCGLAYHPRGVQIASGSYDGTVRLWDVASGDCQKTFDGHKDVVLSVAYSPDGVLIASSSMDQTVRIWNVESLECRHTLSPDGEGDDKAVWNVAFSPQGRQLASATDDGNVRLWDLESGKCTSTLAGHSSGVYCVTYSPQGDLLASGSRDLTVRLWDVATGGCQSVIRNFQEAIRGIAWEAMLGGSYLVTGSEDGLVLNFQVIDEAEQFNVSLKWCTMKGALTVLGASLQDVSGLTRVNWQLLEQRRAVGEPGQL